MNKPNAEAFPILTLTMLS